MTTITKERLLTIKQWRETYGPGSNVVLPAEEAEELARIALTSLEAEPVAYIFKHPAGKLFWALTDESNKEQADVIPVYAAAPASVVPDNASEPLAYAYKELTPEIMRNHLAVFERYGIAPNDSSTTIQALRIALDGIERSDAMLHGAEPVSQTYKLNELAGNSPVIPGEVLSAILKVARVRADFDDFDGDRRGIGDCLDEAEQELIVTINKYASQLAAEPIATNDVREQTAAPPVPVVPAALPENDDEDGHDIDYLDPSEAYALGRTAGWNACRAAMLQGKSEQPQNAQQNIPENIPGGNSPVTPDGWISCSELMPKKNQNVLISVNFDSDLVEPLICSARYTGSTFRRGDATIKPGNGIEQATHWMLLPEPPQGVNDELA
ncbi:DUF551 domain-containing protein [Escherichia coli]|nr:DUF551 domain-containing protein [Escherichia coli]